MATCEWVYCIYAPPAPSGTRLSNLQYNGSTYSNDTTEVEFDSEVKYYCFNGMKAEDDLSFTYTEATCTTGNEWDTDATEWKTCVESK